MIAGFARGDGSECGNEYVKVTEFLAALIIQNSV
jgi:hypothetical protein